MAMHYCRLFFLAGLMLLAVCPPSPAKPLEPSASSAVACAASDTAPAPALFAGSWGIGRWFSGTGGRARVVQLCVVTMCIALFIMMRKLN